MEVIRLNYPEDYKRNHLEPSSLAVGFFDGVHRGHQQVIQAAIDYASENDLESAVMTFDPHPLAVLKNEPLSNFLLTSLEEKVAIFEKMGIRYLFVVTFNKDLAKLSPQEFVDKFFIDLSIQHVSAGFDYSFGHKGAGKIHDMDQYARGKLTYTVVDKVTFESEKVSSTRIRELLNQGQPEQVKELLGRAYTLTGHVVKGYQRGREIGYPTANLEVDESRAIPKVGIYAVTAVVQGKNYDGMASIGYNPTFEEKHDKPLIEVHLFNFDCDIYNESIQVSFWSYIRDELAFNGVDELTQELKEDERKAKKALKNHS
ncbi:bifunctional riboflavin kinase/FAD synthetase [Allobacillus sp. GCM10007491]|uniref:Riboflavin biosynthesis protein n=1 Tax=Allobacillus saliphilus TaxID=2912308 RepID=A0A941CUG2_9BACI|nr:bifunctional riboflavin kinase/FAD synthetase [Allobacillus saliphilus]MBR7552935.1 bifunctional riboflavin kinase/FAD synthetase [Allobacillus saliphilus]